jgi:hypothetical protein
VRLISFLHPFSPRPSRLGGESYCIHPGFPSIKGHPKPFCNDFHVDAKTIQFHLISFHFFFSNAQKLIRFKLRLVCGNVIPVKLKVGCQPVDVRLAV